MLTPDELARTTGRSPEVIRIWCRSGALPAVRAGHFWLLPPEAIDLVSARPRVNRRRPSIAA